MLEKTPNAGLVKATNEETFDVEILLNDNWDAIDSELLQRGVNFRWFGAKAEYEGVTSTYQAVSLLLQKIGTTVCSVIVPYGSYVIDRDFTLPNNITWVFMPGASFRIVENAFVQIKGEIQAPSEQIFTGLGKVTLSPENNVLIRSSWWGAGSVVKSRFSIDGVNKICWGTQSPDEDTNIEYWKQGDIQYNLLATSGGVIGWSCVRDGLNLPKWEKDTAYRIGDIVKPTDNNGHYYTCIEAGTSGATEPEWKVITGTITNDGATLRWKETGVTALFKPFGLISD